MAFKAKDGSAHTNHESMKRADAKHAAKQPAPAEHEPDPNDQGEPQEGEHEISSPEDLMNAFEQHMQQHASGQQPDPHNAKRLQNHFAKFTHGAGDPNGY